MKIKVLIVLVLVLIVGGMLVINNRVEVKETPKRSDFFKNDLSKIKTDDGKKF